MVAKLGALFPVETVSIAAEAVSLCRPCQEVPGDLRVKNGLVSPAEEVF
jgi:hypothetical protein